MRPFCASFNELVAESVLHVTRIHFCFQTRFHFHLLFSPSNTTSLYQQTHIKMAGLFGSSTSSQNAANNSLGDLSKDITLSSPPEDSISDLCFSPASNHLAVSSWDNKVRVYEIAQSGASEGKAMFEHQGPVLSCHWSGVRLQSF